MNRIVKHIEGSKVYGTDYRGWRRQRHFIAAEIDTTGTFLDLGCANGFLMCCLQKWSGHEVIPYGIDIDPAAVEDCRRLFLSHDTHFLCRDVRDFADDLPAEFPTRYDYVFWNIPTHWPRAEKRQQVTRLVPLVASGGKLLLAVYGSNATGLSPSQWEADGRSVTAVFVDLQQRGVVFRHIRYNPWGTHHGIGLVDLGTRSAPSHNESEDGDA